MIKCKFTKPDGKKCQAWAMTGKDFCFSHDPDKKQERSLACSKGGMTPKKNLHPLPKVKLKEQKDVARLLAKTINEVRTGEIELKVATCIGYLSNILIKALSQGELENRLEALEETIAKKTT